MTTTQVHPQIAELQSVLNAKVLKANDQKFAADLLHSYHKYGKLTERQWPWVDKLIHRAKIGAEPTVKVQLGSFDGVVKLFNTAKATLKFPKVHLMLDGKPITLVLAGPKSKFPGTINVIGEGKFPNRFWYGRITQEGVWEPSLKGLEIEAPLTELLSKFGKNPARVAKEYGKLTGNCCFCLKKLEEAHSVAAGFGPVCAKQRGLYDEWKGAVQKAGLSVEGDIPLSVQDTVKESLQSGFDTSVPFTEDNLTTDGLAKAVSYLDYPSLPCMFCGTDTFYRVDNDVVCPTCQTVLGTLS